MKIFNKIIFFVSVLFLFGSCEPQQDDAITLSTPPTNVTFTVNEKVGEENTYILTSTTSDAFLFSWDLGNGSTTTGKEIEVYYQTKGDYVVTLKAFNNGGFGESTQTINVLQDANLPCPPNSLMEFLTDCGERTWILLQDEGAYWVGPDPMTTWWQSDLNVVNERFCAFDDEWIFNVSGEMEYDTKGDLWAEDYMGFNFECVTDDQLSGDAAAWASGTHLFNTNEDGTEQIVLTGIGAFMGFPKVVNGAEVTSPVGGVTYDVIDRSEDANGKYMELEVDYTVGLWRFKYVSPN